MTVATGQDALAADVLAVKALATSAMTAAGVATANAASALTEADAAKAVADAAAALAAIALSVPGLGVVTSVDGSDKVLIGQGSNTVAITVTNLHAALTTAIAAAVTLGTAASDEAAAAATIASTALTKATDALALGTSASGQAAAAATTAATALTNAATAAALGTAASGQAATATSTAATALANAAIALAAAQAAAVLAGNAFSIPGLTVVTSVGSTDTIPIGQSGSTVAVTVATLLDAETIDVLSAAGAASDADTLLVGQGTNVMTRQTLAALWTWVASHIPGYKVPVLEITANLTVDATYNGKILAVTAAGVTISPNFSLMGAGFECEIVTSGSGTVTWGGGVTATNGGNGLPVGAYAKFVAFTSSAGNVVLASVGTASGGGVSLPGPISGFTLGAVTSTTLAFTWTAPSSGGAVTYYQVQYRVTGAGSWTAAPGTSVASATLSGLASSTSYDVQVAAGNSAGLGTYSATVNGTTAAPSVGAPGTPSGLTASTTTATSAPLSWTAPGSGGAVSSYTVQYRQTSLGGAWTQVSGIGTTSTTVTGLAASTGYDFEVAAVGAGGTSSFTATSNGTTAAAPSTTASWGTYGTALTHGTGGNIYNLQITGGTTPTSVAIGFSTSQSVAPSPMPAPADGWAGNFNGNMWGTYMNAPATPGTYYGWATGYAAGNPLFTIVGAPITVT